MIYKAFLTIANIQKNEKLIIIKKLTWIIILLNVLIVYKKMIYLNSI